MRPDSRAGEEAEGAVPDEDKKRAAHRALVDGPGTKLLFALIRVFSGHPVPDAAKLPTSLSPWRSPATPGRQVRWGWQSIRELWAVSRCHEGGHMRTDVRPQSAEAWLAAYGGSLQSR